MKEKFANEKLEMLRNHKTEVVVKCDYKAYLISAMLELVLNLTIFNLTSKCVTPSSASIIIC